MNSKLLHILFRFYNFLTNGKQQTNKQNKKTKIKSRFTPGSLKIVYFNGFPTWTVRTWTVSILQMQNEAVEERENTKKTKIFFFLKCCEVS